MSSFNTNSIKGWVGKIFPDLRKTQIVNLSLGVFGLVRSRSGLMSEIVREIPGSSKHKHRLKRFWRFVSNPKIKPVDLINLWSIWVIKTFVSGRYVTVALDWTTLPGNIQCLMAAIPFGGRAIPLLWVTTTYQTFKDSQNLIEQRLITRLLNIIPNQKRIILVADRGFGRAKFFKFLLQSNILFAIRVRADVKVRVNTKPGKDNGKTILLRKLKLKSNQVKWFESISYRKDGFVSKINLAATIAKDSDDSWLIITNLKSANATIKRYESRFAIEEWFKDLKHQLGIANIQTKDLARVRRLILISAVAYGLIMLVGTITQRLSTLPDQLITGGKRSASRIWFALRIIHYQLLPKVYWKRIWLRALGP